ncbi:ABC transporter permease [Bacillus sp. A301a_S52]|nr:ABC transporter permease [Bacillus sp. A301a_S52]
MTFSMKRMYAIFNKDLKDLSKNMYVLTTIVTPVVLAFLFSRQDELILQMHYLIINLTFATVATFVQSALIAEEKEKNTLRGLMMSPASIGEILIGKSLVSTIMTVVTLIVCMRIMGYSLGDAPILIVAFVLVISFYIALGTWLGLVTRSLIEASIMIVPIMFLLGMGTLLIEIIGEYPILSFLEYLPNFQLEFLALRVEEGASWTNLGSYFSLIVLWLIVMCSLIVITYRKRAVNGE